MDDAHPPIDRITKRINSIGCGNSQLTTFLVATFMLLCDGQEMLVMSLVNLRLKSLWHLSPAAEGTLGSCVFAGVLIGSVLSGAAADIYGRRRALLVFLTILAVAGLLSAVAPTFPWLIAIRTIAGIGLGGTIPTTNCLISEVVPDRSRATVMLSVGVGFTLGECLTALQAMALDLNNGNNWRWLLAWSAFPAFAALIVSLFFLDESPRYLQASGKIKEAKALLNKMADQNERPWCCCCCNGRTEREEETSRPTDEDHNDGDADDTSALLVQDQHTKALDDSSPATAPGSGSCCRPMVELFAVARPLDTIMVWIIFMVASSVFYGLVWVFPLTLAEGGGNENNSGVSSKVLFGALAELPSILIPILFIDWLGRKGTLTLSFVVCIPIAVACAVFSPHLRKEVESAAYFWSVMGLKCMISVSFNVIYVYAAEYVPSKVRGFAVGMGSAASRIGGIVTPYAMVLFHRSHIASPYWFMVVACVVGLVASCVMQEVGKHMR